MPAWPPAFEPRQDGQAPYGRLHGKASHGDANAPTAQSGARSAAVSAATWPTVSAAAGAGSATAGSGRPLAARAAPAPSGTHGDLAMIRALSTLAGLAAAAALLLLVPDIGSAEGGGLWKRAALLAAAGLVAGAFYQLGGIRRPGWRVNGPMLIGAFLPWTVLAIAICAQRSGTPSSLTRWVRDVLPDNALTRWSASFPVLAFTSGLLLAFCLVEPRIRVRAREVTTVAPTAEPVEPVEHAERVDNGEHVEPAETTPSLTETR
jgi:hypothetical protein